MANDDRWDDEGEPGGPEPVLSVRELARRKVRGPAIALIAVGVISLLNMAVGIVQYQGMPAQFAELRQNIDEDAKATADEKKLRRDVTDAIEKFAVGGFPFAVVSSTLIALFTIVVGAMLLGLSGRRLGFTAGILNMLPIASGCCLLGLPIGIWVMVVLSRADVIQGFAAEARRRRGPDTLDDVEGL